MTQHIWTSTDGDMANTSSWDDGTVPATAATGTLTLTGNPLNNETVTLDTKTYTFQTTLTDVDGNVKIGADPEESLDNLVAAITLGAGAGTAYAASTTLHPSVTAADGAGYTMDVTAKKTGTDGNSIATTETIISGSFGGATLSGATQWASTDEIIVPSSTTVGMLTNVDWWTNTSPVLQIARMNVDGPEIPFTKAIGSVANPLRLILDRLNYLGTGEIHIDNKAAGGATPADIPEYVIDSFSGSLCAYLDGMVGAVFVKKGYARILASATLNEDDATPSLVAVLSPSARLDIQGLDSNGAQLLMVQSGRMDNARKQTLTEHTIVLIGQTGKLYQTGIWPLRQRLFVINLGGLLDYNPTNDPSTYGPILQLISGKSTFGSMVYSLETARPVIGPFANVSEGVLDVMTNDPIDLRKDFPL